MGAQFHYFKYFLSILITLFNNNIYLFAHLGFRVYVSKERKKEKKKERKKENFDRKNIENWQNLLISSSSSSSS